MPIITCDRALSEDFLFDCDNPPLQGLTDVVALINYNDIDRVATTFDPLNSQIVTSLVLKNDKRAYRLEGYKLANSAAAELVVKEAPAVNAFPNMSLGAKLVAVVERKYKGANQESAFMVFGYDSGMELTTATYNSNENAGTMPFTVANPGDEEEPKPPLIWLDTDYGTTLTAFEALFGGY